MSRSIRGWRRVLGGLVPVGLLLGACTSAPGVSNQAGVAAPRAESAAVAHLHEHHPASSDEAPAAPLTINVYVTDAGFQPASIFIPAGQEVQLVMRNLGVTEHHLRVLGLVPRDLMRPAKNEAVTGSDGDDHAQHHGASGVPFGLSASSTGLPRIGDEVHAHAVAGGMDVVFFTATKTGTFAVQCPLHPGMVGEVAVL